ncbi:leucine-rich repeat flightless-interacting protein 1-like isoform X2 [Ictalurus furcatus]|uniref:leucine-rich repeat flightless-interacting protein 1-like isoform X2 n=1 Tax=Ictalurus furcatus TaxID=66913 RepID=UPI00234FC4A0|nr:leucine-rich repeat flightless-interacting protein 1-like isoform X2 [Ictalurus furcatus]
MEANTQLENMETNTQVGDINLNNSYLMSKVNTLEDSVQQLYEELAQTQMRCNEIMREREQEQEAHRILESQCEEMKTTLKTRDELLKVCEGEVKGHSILKVSLAEVERKYKQAMESNAHLENETFDLMSKMGILQNSMQEMTNKCAEATENYEKTKRILEFVLATANEREKTLNLEIDLLQASLAEAERQYEFLVTDYYETVDTQNNLRAELSTLHGKVGDLQGALRTVTRERKREQACLAEAERKYKEVMESNAQLEKEKSDLQSQVNTLQGSVQQLKEEHSETRTKCDEMLVSLAAADNLYEEAMQSKAKMKNEILDLKYHLHTLRDSVRELEIMLSDGEMHCDAIKQETEQEREAYRILKIQYKKMKETIQRFRELLINYHTELGFEEQVDL